MNGACHPYDQHMNTFNHAQTDNHKMKTIIRNALVYDGSGNPPQGSSDVAVENGVISQIGKGLDPAGAEIIGADDLALMSGIIDTHTHYDAQVTWDPLLDPSSSLGVTTAVIGNCGFTIAPCREADRELIMRNLTQVEGMSLDALRAGIDWSFESVPEYLDMIERRGLALNVAAFIGHSSLRTYVMGNAATERAANDDEITAMEAIVDAGMRAGAIGFATSTAPQHNGHGGLPMPSRLADDRELEALGSVLGKHGRGIFMLTKGARTDVPYLENLAKKIDRPIMIAALLHNSTNPTGTFDELAAITAARRRGQELWGQVSCCPLTMDFTIRSAYPFESLGAWSPAMKVGPESLPAILSDTAFRDAVRAELAEPAGVRLFNGEWHKLLVVEVGDAAHAHAEGKTVAQLAGDANVEPLDWMLDFAIADGMDTIFTAVLLNSDEDAVGRMIRDPSASVALSDAGAHLTFFCDAGFGLHLMGHWSRDLGALPLEMAVHELSGKPAEIFRIPDRGRIAPGYHADLLLFDPATVGRGPNRRVFDLPGNGPRLTCSADGVHGVWVNGTRIANENGLLPISIRSGRLLREFGS